MNTPTKTVSRKDFLIQSGMAVTAAGLLLAGCRNDDDALDDPNEPEPETFDLGSGNTALLNLAFALEQLQHRLYTRILDSPYEGITQQESTILADMRRHQQAHMDLFEAYVTDGRIGRLASEFSSVNFNDRNSVLTFALNMEEMGVQYFNGAVRHYQNSDALLLMAKVHSVEARHASVIHYLLNPGVNDFANNDIITSDRLEITRTPRQVLEFLEPFTRSTLTASGLPS